ncbi:MAG: hypothetical protein RL133_1184 [Pseudomonadota bacterium]
MTVQNERQLELHWERALTLGECVDALHTFQPLVAKALAPGVTLQCSLASWRQVDTSALTVLLALRRQALEARATIRFLHSPPTLKSLAHMSQVDALLNL